MVRASIHTRFSPLKLLCTLCNLFLDKFDCFLYICFFNLLCTRFMSEKDDIKTEILTNGLENVQTKFEGKATKLEAYKRTSEVVRLILQGVRYTDIVEYCDKNWGIKKRQASIYYKRGLEYFKEQFDEEKKYEIDKHTMMLYDLYTKGYRSGDLNICRLLLQDIAKMKGMSIDRVDVTSGGEGFIFNYNKPVDGEEKI